MTHIMHDKRCLLALLPGYDPADDMLQQLASCSWISVLVYMYCMLVVPLL